MLMKKYNKIIVCILLLNIVCVLFISLCGCEQGEYVVIDGNQYNIFIKQHKAQFVAVVECAAAEPIVVTVPSYVTYQGQAYPVTRVTAQLGYFLGAGAPRSIVENGYVKELVIPETVEYIDFGMYQMLDFFERITVNKDNAYYKDIDGILYNKYGNKLEYYPDGRTDASFTVLQNVTDIQNSNLHFNTYLETIEVENDNVRFKSIDGVLYSYYNGLKLEAYPKAKTVSHFVVPESVEALDLNVFRDCKNLKTVYLHESLKEIDVGYYLGDAQIYCGKDSAPKNWNMNDYNASCIIWSVPFENYITIIEN